MASLEDSVLTLKGIGPAKAKLYERLGIRTVGELLTYLPRAYEDRTRMTTISRLRGGETACFTAMVVSDPTVSRPRKGLEITRIWVADDTGRLTVTFFNQSYAAAQLEKGRTYVFCGALTEDAVRRELVGPAFESPDAPAVQTRCILPVYSQTSGLSSLQISRAIGRLLESGLGQLEETLPARLLAERGLPGIRETWRTIHQPDSMQALQRARDRLVFEEFFQYSVGLGLQRAQREALAGIRFRDTDLTDFYAALPFTLTGAQQRAIDDVVRDLQKGAPMSRLIQGDVGSGKTMVAAAAAWLAVKNGVQAAMMVPTEILARQQYETLSALFAPLGVQVALLTGSLGAAEKRRVYEGLESGGAGLVVGTHALITGGVRFDRLGLVIVDEQHRFGTGQRFALGAKGAQPHTLVMSATPIPRTLALLVYGELDVSIVDEKPPGRQEVQTFLVSERLRQRVNAFIRKHAARGNQVFIVCPAVEDSEENDLKSVQTWAETLQTVVFPELRVALLHGQMKGSEKETVMADFSAGKADILVSTTVIEVGVDVPNATLMVIENAERFGLSQLHQLRGRVGRGQDEAFCILFTTAENPESLQRLRAFASTTDGFAIAQTDLEQRGPGDFFGSRQHGMPSFRTASLAADLEVFHQARQEAERFLADPAARQDPVWPALEKRVNDLFRQDGVALN